MQYTLLATAGNTFGMAAPERFRYGTGLDTDPIFESLSVNRVVVTATTATMLDTSLFVLVSGSLAAGTPDGDVYLESVGEGVPPPPEEVLPDEAPLPPDGEPQSETPTRPLWNEMVIVSPWGVEVSRSLAVHRDVLNWEAWGEEGVNLRDRVLGSLVRLRSSLGLSVGTIGVVGNTTTVTLAVTGGV